jgi:hypothetical protein
MSELFIACTPRTEAISSSPLAIASAAASQTPARSRRPAWTSM